MSLLPNTQSTRGRACGWGQACLMPSFVPGYHTHYLSHRVHGHIETLPYTPIHRHIHVTGTRVYINLFCSVTHNRKTLPSPQNHTHAHTATGMPHTASLPLDTQLVTSIHIQTHTHVHTHTCTLTYRPHTYNYLSGHGHMTIITNKSHDAIHQHAHVHACTHGHTCSLTHAALSLHGTAPSPLNSPGYEAASAAFQLLRTVSVGVADPHREKHRYTHLCTPIQGFTSLLKPPESPLQAP